MHVQDLKVDPLTGDLAIEGNDLVLIDGDDMTVQHLGTRCQIQRGEFVLDTRKGLPWITWFRQKPVSAQYMQSNIRTELEDVEGCKSIDSVRITPDEDERDSEIEFDYTLDSQTVGAANASA